MGKHSKSQFDQSRFIQWFDKMYQRSKKGCLMTSAAISSDDECDESLDSNSSQEEEEERVNKLPNIESGNWSEEKIGNLLSIFQNEGWNGNFEELAIKFPGTMVSSLRLFFTEIATKETLRDTDAWIHLVRDNQSINECVNSAVIFDFLGEHEQSHTSQELDYGSIYKTIASLMRGEVPKDLEPNEEAKMQEIVAKLFEEMDLVGGEILLEENDVQIPVQLTTPVVTKIEKEIRAKEANAVLANRRSRVWSEKELKLRADIASGSMELAWKALVDEYRCFNPLKLDVEKFKKN